MYDFHVTVCRTGKETAKQSELDSFNNEAVNLEYVPIIQMDKTYFWLNVFSLELEQIRTQLGLKLNPYGNTVYSPFSHIFHMTIGNRKWQKAS